MKTRIEHIIDIINRNPNVVERCEYIGFTKELIQEIQRLNTTLDELQAYFTSGNDIPVERATIKASEFYRITQRSRSRSIL